MNRGQIRAQARTLLNESSPGFWLDADLNTYIDMANQRVNSIISEIREDFFTVSATFLLQAGVKSYSLPTDAQFIRRLELYDPSNENDIMPLGDIPFPRIEGGGEWPFASPGRPQRKLVRGNQFDLFPTPDSAYAARIFYDQRKDNFTVDADIPSSPVNYHDMIVFWACVLAKKQNEEDDGGYADLFNTRKQELISMLTRRSGEDPRFVEGYLEGD
jgi:hypothetical protein